MGRDFTEDEVRVIVAEAYQANVRGVTQSEKASTGSSSLFTSSLTLPAVLRGKRGTWRPPAGIREEEPALGVGWPSTLAGTLPPDAPLDDSDFPLVLPNRGVVDESDSLRE